MTLPAAESHGFLVGIDPFNEGLESAGRIERERLRRHVPDSGGQISLTDRAPSKTGIAV
jgi:hypothetical protein